MCVCHRADRSIWAPSTVLALPISSLHWRIYSCCVSYHGTPHAHRHKYQFTEGGSWGQASTGLHAWCMSWNTAVHYFFRGKQANGGAGERGRERGRCMYSCGKRAMLFPVSSRKACQSYGWNATVLHRVHTHALPDSLMVRICMCAHLCIAVYMLDSVGLWVQTPNLKSRLSHSVLAM